MSNERENEWVLVPRVASLRMLGAGCDALYNADQKDAPRDLAVEAIWIAMRKAAPSPPAEVDPTASPDWFGDALASVGAVIPLTSPPADAGRGGLDRDALTEVVMALKRACDEGLITNPLGLHTDAVGVLADAANDALTAKAAAPAPVARPIWVSPFGSCVCGDEYACPGCNPNAAIELAQAIATNDERRKHAPCMECGAVDSKDAESKCHCSGDKDDCHGVELWPDSEAAKAAPAPGVGEAVATITVMDWYPGNGPYPIRTDYTEAGAKLPTGTKLYAHPAPADAQADPPAPQGDAVELALCCGREECGGECGIEWRGTAWFRRSPAVELEALAGKYGDVLRPFVAMMDHELHANAGKGDRPGWLQMDRKTALLEIYYHLAKLQKATRDNDEGGIREYAADVANMSMMLVDVCGFLPVAVAQPVPQGGA